MWWTANCCPTSTKSRFSENNRFNIPDHTVKHEQSNAKSKEVNSDLECRGDCDTDDVHSRVRSRWHAWRWRQRGWRTSRRHACRRHEQTFTIKRPIAIHEPPGASTLAAVTKSTLVSPVGQPTITKSAFSTEPSNDATVNSAFSSESTDHATVNSAFHTEPTDDATVNTVQSAFHIARWQPPRCRPAFDAARW